MSNPVTKGTVQKGKISMKGWFLIFTVAIVGGIVAIAINNNVAKVGELTETRRAWYNPLGWF